MPKCQHEEFEANVKVGRLQQEEGGPVTHYTAEVVIICMQCRVAFEFVGLPMGHSSYEPMTNVDQTELRAPIMPPGETVPLGLTGLEIHRDGELPRPVVPPWVDG